MRNRSQIAIIAAATALLNGCASFPQPTDAKKVAEAIGHVKPSEKDTCVTQKSLAAQSSRIDTIINGRETVYKAKCSSKTKG